MNKVLFANTQTFSTKKKSNYTLATKRKEDYVEGTSSPKGRTAKL